MHLSSSSGLRPWWPSALPTRRLRSGRRHRAAEGACLGIVQSWPALTGCTPSIHTSSEIVEGADSKAAIVATGTTSRIHQQLCSFCFCRVCSTIAKEESEVPRMCAPMAGVVFPTLMRELSEGRQQDIATTLAFELVLDQPLQMIEASICNRRLRTVKAHGSRLCQHCKVADGRMARWKLRVTCDGVYVGC